MKVCLISPGWIATRGDVDTMFSRCGLPLPLGLGYLASFAEKEGFSDITIIDLLISGWDARTEIDPERVYIGLTEDTLRQKLDEASPDVVGISCTFTSQAESLHRVAAQVKRINPGLKIFVGGAHPSSDPDSCLKDKNIDLVVRGEGELPFLELMKRGFTGDLSSIKGIHFRDGEVVRSTGDGEYLKELDQIPYPAYDKMDTARYLEASDKGLGQRGGYSRAFSIITSRGCPYQCVFCSIHNISGSRWRGRTTENVMGEIDLLVERYGAGHLLFEDDNLTMDIDRAEAIFNKMAKRHKGLTWSAPNGIRADRMTDGLARAMRRSGCASVSLGIESGDQEFLNGSVRKKLDLEDVKKTVKILAGNYITVIGFFILGIPGETEESIRTSIGFATNLSRKGVIPHFFIVTPLPGTPLIDICKKDNLLVKKDPTPMDYFHATYQAPMIRPTGMSMEALLAWRRKAVLTTMLNLAFCHPVIFMKYLSGNNSANPRLVFLGLKRKFRMAVDYLWK